MYCRRLPIIILIFQLDMVSKSVQTSTKKSISIFDYCSSMFLVEDNEYHEILLDGILFPTGERYCEVKYTAKNSFDKLNYKVTKSLIYESNMNIKVESSSDGGAYLQEDVEMLHCMDSDGSNAKIWHTGRTPIIPTHYGNQWEYISYNTRPSNPHQKMVADRQVRLSVNRVSGYVTNRFSVVIEVTGKAYREDNSDTEPDRSLGPTATFGITIGVCLVILAIVVGCVCIRQLELNRKWIRAQTGHPPDDDHHDVPPSVHYTTSSGQPALGFMPPHGTARDNVGFQPEVDGDNMIAVTSPPPYTIEVNKPPSYSETMKMGLSEITI